MRCRQHLDLNPNPSPSPSPNPNPNPNPNPQAAAFYEYLVDDPSLHYGLSPYGTPSPPPPPPHLYGYKQGLDILGQAA